MNAILADAVAPEVAAVLETLASPVALVRDGGLVCYANAPARRLAGMMDADVDLGLARLTSDGPECLHTATGNGAGCEDCVEWSGANRPTLTIVRHWRDCGHAGLRTVSIRPLTTRQGLEALGHAPPLHAEACRPGVTGGDGDLLQADKLATVGQLAAGMAHEINNPICYVQSNLGTLADYVNKLFGLLELADPVPPDVSLADSQRHAALAARKRAIDFSTLVQDLPVLLAETREGVERIRHIVQSLRDFSRTDSGTAFGLFDVRRALDAAVDMVRNLGGGRVEYAVHCEPLPLIECNATELTQLFTNVLVNATQAMDGNGHVGVRARPTDPTHIEVEIRDDGCGIEPATLEHIFEPFFTTKGPSKGTGLGLSISYAIVKQHAGNIVVRSTPGRGTTFRVTLPTRQRADGPARA